MFQMRTGRSRRDVAVSCLDEGLAEATLIGMRDELREMTAGYVTTVVALMAWSSRFGASNWTVFGVFLGGLIVGSIAWIVVVERRLPWPLRRGEARGAQPAWSALVAVAAVMISFLAHEWARAVWPSRGEIFLDQPLRSVSPDGSVITDTFVTYYDIPLNAARGIIVYFAVLLAVLVIGVAISSAIDSWRRRQHRVLASGS